MTKLFYFSYSNLSMGFEHDSLNSTNPTILPILLFYFSYSNLSMGFEHDSLNSMIPVILPGFQMDLKCWTILKRVRSENAAHCSSSPHAHILMCVSLKALVPQNRLKSAGVRGLP
jgi:hypothetical protein